jgi:hypothetical protein
MGNNQYGGHLLVTLDPIVEHGIQQITHLDNYVDKLIFCLLEKMFLVHFRYLQRITRLNYQLFYNQINAKGRYSKWL